MGALYTRLTLVTVILLQLSTSVFAGPLDDYYLQQFGETKTIQLQKAILLVTADVQESAHCGMPLKHSLKRDWDLLELSTQKVLAKQLAAPTLSASLSTPHFIIHYDTSGANAPDITTISQYTGLVLNNAADWAIKVGDAFEFAYSSYLNQGYHPPPNIPYDIYLTSLASAGEYGETQDILRVSTTSFPYASSSFIQIDKDFTNSIFHPTTYTPLQSLQITSAHEFHHAIQYGYNFFFDVWYAEATSTWMEDELYDGVNQSYSYIPAWFSNSTAPLDLAVGTDAVSSGAGYGRWIFNRYLSEKHGSAMIRDVWQNIAPLPSPGGYADIPMAPVLDSVLSSSTYATSLSSDFFGFAKRVYTRDWTTHTSETGKIHAYSPVATYAAYPVNSTVSTPTPSITLPHYSFAYYRFTPTAGVSSLSISINKTTGIQTALFKNGSELTADASSTSTFTFYVTSGIGTSDEVALLIANTTSTDSHSANFSTDGKLLAVTEPATPASSTSSGPACFIATAAYGSYLHPQVQLLRNFRDKYLLTNAPGRSFVALYYRCSPPLADFIARHKVLRSVTRLVLTPVVIAVVHPLISAAFLFLLAGTLLMSLLRRIKTARSKASPHVVHAT